jgi:hypothetical protein
MTETVTRPKKGDRYLVRTSFAGYVLTQWRAPFTDGSEQTFPARLEFVVMHDPPENAAGVAAHPDPYAVWETKLVMSDERQAEKYAGYYVVVTFDALNEHCELLVNRPA